MLRPRPPAVHPLSQPHPHPKEHNVTRSHHPPLRAILACLAAAALAGFSVFSAAASAQPDAPAVPERIQVEDGNQPFLLAHAVGVQIYACTATPDGPKW